MYQQKVSEGSDALSKLLTSYEGEVRKWDTAPPHPLTGLPSLFLLLTLTCSKVSSLYFVSYCPKLHCISIHCSHSLPPSLPPSLLLALPVLLSFTSLPPFLLMFHIFSSTQATGDPDKLIPGAFFRLSRFLNEVQCISFVFLS